MPQENRCPCCGVLPDAKHHGWAGVVGTSTKDRIKRGMCWLAGMALDNERVRNSLLFSAGLAPIFPATWHIWDPDNELQRNLAQQYIEERK